MTTEQTHRAVLTVTATSRPDGGNYFDQADFAAHVTGWVRAGLKGKHAVDEVTITAAPAVPSAAAPPTQAALRDRIRRAVCETEGFGFAWGTDMLEPDEYGEIADAVLAVLPAPVDRAAVLRDFLWRLEQSAGDAAAEKLLDDNPELRRLAEAPQAETQDELFVPPTHYRGRDGTAYCVHATPVGPDSCRECRELDAAAPAVVAQPGAEG